MKKTIEEKILEKIDIVDLISKYVDLKKSGSGYKGLSPFKDEKTPSFMVSPTKKIFKDFSSNKGGNAISFYMYINNISYNQAIVELSEKYGIQNIKVSEYNKYSKYYEIMEKARDFYHKNLLNNKKALNYLEKRAYSLEDIKQFKLGFADNNWDFILNNLKKENISLEDMQELGLIYKKDDKIYDSFRNRIMIPISNYNSRVIGFGARTIESSESAKYINSKESKIFKKSNELFGIFDKGNIIKTYNSCILVEGFFDVLSLQKNNIANVIASLGTALTEKQAEYIKKLTSNIVIAYDDDKAGIDAKIRAIYILNKYDFNIKIMPFENLAKDPDELINKYGREKFQELYNKSQDAFEFLYKYYTKAKDIDNIIVKKNVIENMKEYFNTISNKIIFDEYLQRFASLLNVDSISLKSAINRKTVFKIKEQTVNNTRKINVRRRLEEKTIGIVLFNPSKYELFSKFEFENIDLSELFHKIINKNFDRYNCSEKEKSLIFQILSEQQIDTKEYVIIYREWLKIYFNNSKSIIEEFTNNFEDMSIEEYEKIIEFIKKFNNIKNFTLEELEQLFDNYLEYEKGRLHAN